MVYYFDFLNLIENQPQINRNKENQYKLLENCAIIKKYAH